jgi:ribosomal protein S12 methylthiotransferase accessory factor YcaO
MVSRKLRNKTRKRGGGGCGVFGCLPNAKSSAVVEPTPINATRKVANNLRKKARKQIVQNRANARAQRQTELAELRRQGEERAKIYANSREPMNGKTLSQGERDVAYQRYMIEYNQKIQDNILTNQALTTGLNSILREVPVTNFTETQFAKFS